MLKADVPARPNGTKELVTEFAVEDMKNTEGLVSIGKEELGWVGMVGWGGVDVGTSFFCSGEGRRSSWALWDKRACH